MKLRHFFCFAAFACLSSTVLAAPVKAEPSLAAKTAFDNGIKAYGRGDTESAVMDWRAAADAGHPEAAFLMGRLYEEGMGTIKSPSQSFHYYKMAANEGNVQAAAKVGIIYRDGNKDLEIDRDYELARKNFEKGALAFWPESQFYLADMYRRGLGVPPDRTESLRWLILAAKKKYAPSHLELARIYFAGEGVLPDRVVGWSHIELASRFADKTEGPQVNAAMDKYRKRMKAGEIEAARIEADTWVAKNVTR
jgi:TPR repeat protein